MESQFMSSEPTPRRCCMQKPFEVRTTRIVSVAIFNIAAMLVVILKKSLWAWSQGPEDTVCNTFSWYTDNKILVSAHFYYSSHVGGHFENKLTKTISGWRVSILCAENPVPSRRRSRTHGYTDARGAPTSWAKELALAKAAWVMKTFPCTIQAAITIV